MPGEIRPDHVAVYIRWSTEDQGDGTTLAVQSEACAHYVLSQGWLVRQDLTYIDDGWSGGSLDRPALTRLREAVRQGLVDCVVVFRLDRLSRSVIDTVTLVLQEWADLTHVKSAREPVDTTTAMGRQFFYMLVSYAEWERNVIRERMFSGKLRRTREGRSPGMPAAYGYQIGDTPGTLTAQEQEAAVVRLTFGLAERGLSIRQITRHLNQQGYPTRKGGPWGTSMVAKLLRNPLYAGTLVWGRRQINPRYGKAPGERKFKAAVPHAVVENAVLPVLIGRQQFDKVQQVLEGRKELAPGAAGSCHLLTGLLRCAECGRLMQFNEYRHWSYYRCGGKAQDGTCGAPSIPARPLEEAVAGEVARRFGPLALHEAQAEQERYSQAHLAQREADLAALQGALARLEAQRRRIDQDYRQGQVTAAERRALLAQVGAEMAGLARSEAELREPPGAAPDPGADPWAVLTPAEQKQLLRFFLSEVRARRCGRALVEAELHWVEGVCEDGQVR